MSRNGLTDNDPRNGAGPFLFEVRPLAAGERWSANLRDREYNGRKRGLKRFLPFDTVSVTNGSATATVRLVINGQYEAAVPPNTTEAFGQTSVSQVEVVNQSDTATAAGEVTVEAVKEPYDEGDAARRDARQGVVSQLAENFVGVTPGDLFGGGR